MLARKYLFPHVIEMNYQAGHRLGVNVYLIDGGDEFLLIDIGFEDTVDEIVENSAADVKYRQLGTDRPPLAETLTERDGRPRGFAVEHEQLPVAQRQPVVVRDVEARFQSTAVGRHIPRREPEDRHERIQITNLERLRLLRAGGSGRMFQRFRAEPMPIESDSKNSSSSSPSLGMSSSTTSASRAEKLGWTVGARYRTFMT